ncbi:serine hydrolase domain-containing protein [Bacillus bingmayongensis]|uniref:serine hydrolase domain-containing protein n=1 Tax=Bacillus bingmayongensis TaxID=1150157 RepID=UPI00030533B5|nr:serine hydrolase domain-containing protein [Bacillus bingmayongensis]MBY0594994.1 beta-lactamase family protein [Bacillus bingmayongensis]
MRNSCLKRLIFLIVTLILLFNFSVVTTNAYSKREINNVLKLKELQDIISYSLKGDNAPGASITITNGAEVIYGQYGFSNIKEKTPITTDTLFELGSTTKAFTALAMLILEDEGILSLKDSVSKYVPWFNVNFNGEKVEITIEQLIHHSSGLPEKTINKFPKGTSHNLLEKTVRLSEGITLDFYPGTHFEYANIGYDLLAYILEMATGQKYEDFVKEKILLPLGMNNSYYNLKEAEKTGDMAQGYLPFFFRTSEYDAPRYQGSLADGYLITSSKDMGIWLNAQLGSGDVPKQLARLIKKSHTINNDIIVGESKNKPLYYAYGWIVTKDGSYITHSGENPSFTSNIIILPKKDVAIGVQSNSPGSQTINISQNIMNHLNNEPQTNMTFSQGSMDKIFSIGILILTVLIILVMIFISTMRKRINKKNEINFKKEKLWFAVKMITGLFFMIILVIWPYLIDYSFNMVLVWMPFTQIIFNVLCAFLTTLLLISSMIRFNIIKQINFKQNNV